MITNSSLRMTHEYIVSKEAYEKTTQIMLGKVSIPTSDSYNAKYDGKDPSPRSDYSLHLEWLRRIRDEHPRQGSVLGGGPIGLLGQGYRGEGRREQDDGDA